MTVNGYGIGLYIITGVCLIILVFAAFNGLPIF